MRDIKFRCSSLGKIMTNQQGKSNLEKYNEAVESLEKYKFEYAEMKNKETKTAQKKLEQIEKYESAVSQLYLTKDEVHLSETCKKELIKVFAAHKYNRTREIRTKFFDKGIETEEDSITTVCRVTKQFLKKNEVELSNDFITGTPDLFIGESIYNAEEVRDTKSSWDLITFLEAKNDSLNSDYLWQLQGYAWLTGAKRLSVDYCLNNTPFNLIEQEIRKESYNLRDVMPQWAVLQILANHVYDRATFCDYMQKLMIFEFEDEKAEHIFDTFVEIPLKERHFNFEFERDDSKIEAIKTRIIECRNWMEANLFKKV
jgi:hypothetical protein